MPTNFPTSLDSYTNKVDGVDTVQAAHVNNLQDAVVAIETKLGNNSQGVLVPRTAGNSAVALDGTVAGAQITIPNGGTASVFGGSPLGGLIMITEVAVDGSIAVFAVSGGGGLQEMADPGGIFTTTFNNPSSINVYFNVADLRIQNNRGSSRTFNVMVLRTR